MTSERPSPVPETEELSPRKKHIAWCKQRALEFVDQGDFNQAYASMLQDLRLEECTAAEAEICLTLGGRLLVGGFLNSDYDARHWIEGF